MVLFGLVVFGRGAPARQFRRCDVVVPASRRRRVADVGALVLSGLVVIGPAGRRPYKARGSFRLVVSAGRRPDNATVRCRAPRLAGVAGLIGQADHLAAADSAADAAGGDADLAAPAVELVHHVDDLAGAGAADRVAERDPAAPLVGPLGVEIGQIVEGAAEHRGEGLVELEEVDIAEADRGALA